MANKNSLAHLVMEESLRGELDEDEFDQESMQVTPSPTSKSVQFNRIVETATQVVKPNASLLNQLQITMESMKSKCSQLVIDPSRKQFLSIIALIPNDVFHALNQFNEKQKRGPIDIWWLTEDGGLTILIPYLINISYNWSECYLRLFCISQNGEETETIRNKYVSCKYSNHY